MYCIQISLEMSRYRVFVYGTLKRGEPNYHVIGNPASGVSQFVGEGKTVAKYPLVAAAPWYNPYLLPAENQEEAKVCVNINTVALSVCLSVCLPVCLSALLFLYVSVCLSIHLSLDKFVCLLGCHPYVCQP